MHCGIEAALRIPLAVTWLMVYRQLRIYVAEQVFKHDVLEIHLSDLYKNLVEPALDSKD